MKDIENRADIELLVNTFYDKVKQDDTIGYIFNDIAAVDWPKHLPKMYDFWENVLLGVNSYQGNPMLPHFKLNQKIKLETVHFDRWKDLFVATVNELFTGSIAEEACLRAYTIAGIMQYKIDAMNGNNPQA